MKLFRRQNKEPKWSLEEEFQPNVYEVEEYNPSVEASPEAMELMQNWLNETQEDKSDLLPCSNSILNQPNSDNLTVELMNTVSRTQNALAVSFKDSDGPQSPSNNVTGEDMTSLNSGGEQSSSNGYNHKSSSPLPSAETVKSSFEYVESFRDLAHLIASPSKEFVEIPSPTDSEKPIPSVSTNKEKSPRSESIEQMDEQSLPESINDANIIRNGSSCKSEFISSISIHNAMTGKSILSITDDSVAPELPETTPITPLKDWEESSKQMMDKPLPQMPFSEVKVENQLHSSIQSASNSIQPAKEDSDIDSTRTVRLQGSLKSTSSATALPLNLKVTRSNSAILADPTVSITTAEDEALALRKTSIQSSILFEARDLNRDDEVNTSESSDDDLPLFIVSSRIKPVSNAEDSLKCIDSNIPQEHIEVGNEPKLPIELIDNNLLEVENTVPKPLSKSVEGFDPTIGAVEINPVDTSSPELGSIMPADQVENLIDSADDSLNNSANPEEDKSHPKQSQKPSATTKFLKAFSSKSRRKKSRKGIDALSSDKLKSSSESVSGSQNQRLDSTAPSLDNLRPYSIASEGSFLMENTIFGDMTNDPETVEEDESTYGKEVEGRSNERGNQKDEDTNDVSESLQSNIKPVSSLDLLATKDVKTRSAGTQELQGALRPNLIGSRPYTMSSNSERCFSARFKSEKVYERGTSVKSSVTIIRQSSEQLQNVNEISENSPGVSDEEKTDLEVITVLESENLLSSVKEYSSFAPESVARVKELQKTEDGYQTIRNMRLSMDNQKKFHGIMDDAYSNGVSPGPFALSRDFTPGYNSVNDSRLEDSFPNTQAEFHRQLALGRYYYANPRHSIQPSYIPPQFQRSRAASDIVGAGIASIDQANSYSSSLSGHPIDPPIVLKKTIPIAIPARRSSLFLSPIMRRMSAPLQLSKERL